MDREFSSDRSQSSYSGSKAIPEPWRIDDKGRSQPETGESSLQAIVEKLYPSEESQPVFDVKIPVSTHHRLERLNKAELDAIACLSSSLDHPVVCTTASALPLMFPSSKESSVSSKFSNIESLSALGSIAISYASPVKEVQYPEPESEGAAEKSSKDIMERTQEIFGEASVSVEKTDDPQDSMISPASPPSAPFNRGKTPSPSQLLSMESDVEFMGQVSDRVDDSDNACISETQETGQPNKLGPDAESTPYIPASVENLEQLSEETRGVVEEILKYFPESDVPFLSSVEYSEPDNRADILPPDDNDKIDDTIGNVLQPDLREASVADQNSSEVVPDLHEKFQNTEGLPQTTPELVNTGAVASEGSVEDKSATLAEGEENVSFEIPENFGIASVIADPPLKVRVLPPDPVGDIGPENATRDIPQDDTDIVVEKVADEVEDELKQLDFDVIDEAERLKDIFESEFRRFRCSLCVDSYS